jgi:hypothetical protein
MPLRLVYSGGRPDAAAQANIGVFLGKIQCEFDLSG